MRRHFTLIAAGLAACIIALVGCGRGSAASTDDAGPASVQSATGTLSYPAAYRSLSLPELDGGTLTSTGRQTTSLRDGLALSLTSVKSVDDVREFYRGKLSTLGWTPRGSGRAGSVPNMPIAIVAFGKGRLSFQATITAVVGGAGTTIEIRVTEN